MEVNVEIIKKGSILIHCWWKRMMIDSNNSPADTKQNTCWEGSRKYWSPFPTECTYYILINIFYHWSLISFFPVPCTINLLHYIVHVVTLVRFVHICLWFFVYYKKYIIKFYQLTCLLAGEKKKEEYNHRLVKQLKEYSNHKGNKLHYSVTSCRLHHSSFPLHKKTLVWMMYTMDDHTLQEQTNKKHTT